MATGLVLPAMLLQAARLCGAYRNAADLGPARLQSAAADARVREAGVKDITYVRHGESVGNAGVMGAIAELSATAYWDGILTWKGREQVRQRVSFMGPDLVGRILGSEVVLVSPLRRAMATAIMLLAHTQFRKMETDGRPGSCKLGKKLPDGHQWPPFEVVAEMREKLKSKSEAIGSGNDGDPMIYVNTIAAKVGKQLFCDEDAMSSVVEDIVATYSQERERTKRRGVPWKVHHGGVAEPRDGCKFVNMIRAFKSEVLMRRSETRILMVGHSGWSRYAFGPFFPTDEEPATPSAVLGRSAWSVHALNNVGVISMRFLPDLAEFRPGSDIAPDLVMPGDKKFPNFDSTQKEVLLSDFREAAAAGLVPADSEEGNLVVVKTSSGTRRLYRLSSSRSLSKAFVSWFDRWGKPRDHACVSCGDVNITTSRDKGSLQLSIATSHKGKSRQTALEFETAKELKAFASTFIAYMHFK